MLRDSIGRAFGVGLAVVLLVAVGLGCAAQELTLIGPVRSAALQYRDDGFVVFFSPAAGDAGLHGLRLSITNTSGNTLSIVWSDSFFVLPTGDRSDAITSDVPASFQAGPTQIAIRQTAELVAVPLSSVSHSESGWSIGPIDFGEGDKFTLHLAVQLPGREAVEGYDFTFRLVEPTGEPRDEPEAEPEVGVEADAGSGVAVWSALLALGVGFLLGLLLAAP